MRPPLDQEKLQQELAYAESLGTDLIAVMVHWGIEYQTTQNAYQEQVADFLISHGADLILGSHSHVPQPLETRTVTLDDGSTRSGLVCYSLGNFVSNQSPATVNVNYTDTTAILTWNSPKTPQRGKRPSPISITFLSWSSTGGPMSKTATSFWM